MKVQQQIHRHILDEQLEPPRSVRRQAQQSLSRYRGPRGCRTEELQHGIGVPPEDVPRGVGIVRCPRLVLQSEPRLRGLRKDLPMSQERLLVGVAGPPVQEPHAQVEDVQEELLQVPAEVLEGRPIGVVRVDLDGRGRRDVVANHAVAITVLEQMLPQPLQASSGARLGAAGCDAALVDVQGGAGLKGAIRIPQNPCSGQASSAQQHNPQARRPPTEPQGQSAASHSGPRSHKRPLRDGGLRRMP
mmetsp:Transcript_58933/g.149554  ORF Transcript_58933/g.149554 Transcript_58933/m.149554 type:complete len:245 (-) Transcript_58933:3-737(-)